MLQTPSMDLTKLAKSGHAESIDILLNYFMQSIETTARSSIKDGFIELILEGYTSTPDQRKSEEYLRNFFDYLQIPGIQKVIIFAKNYDTQRLSWWSILEICSLKTPSSEFCESLETHSGQQAIPLPDPLVASQFQAPQPIAFENLPVNLQNSI